MHDSSSCEYRSLEYDILVRVVCSLSSGVDPFVYTRAVVCGGVASTLPTISQRLESSKAKVDLEKARQQQRQYVEVMGHLER